MRRRIVLAAAACPILPARASTWPSSPLRILVGYPPGSSPDGVARLLAPSLSRELGHPVLIENKAGANGTIAMSTLARSDDEHLISIAPQAPLTVARLLNPKLPYDPAADLRPIALIGTTPFVLVAGASAGGDSPLSVLAKGRLAGNGWSYGSSGNGSAAHLGMELLKQRVGWQAHHVPYQGNPPLVTALLSGEVQVALLPPSSFMQHVIAGRLRAVAVMGSQSTLAPGVASIAEMGVRSLEVEGLVAMVAHRRMPAVALKRLEEVTTVLVRNPDIRQQMFGIGFRVVGTGSESLRQRIAQEAQQYSNIIALLGDKARQ
ncbi:tripartite tricarboxylate transporter substrate binding protein [Rhizobacter sp. Root404]|uniref:Bug family tripartite tricarboxylate transporter substrate binding protein n=1 Tax=Rhizobacter sp. Root404 TaxID=1736528 RepID=UPI0009EA8724|nr:tripartite tricarboxylate transporter substrate binding protein [Rhizobacter sp. Root404]